MEHGMNQIKDRGTKEKYTTFHKLFKTKNYLSLRMWWRLNTIITIWRFTIPSQVLYKGKCFISFVQHCFLPLPTPTPYLEQDFFIPLKGSNESQNIPVFVILPILKWIKLVLMDDVKMSNVYIHVHKNR